MAKQHLHTSVDEYWTSGQCVRIRIRRSASVVCPEQLPYSGAVRSVCEETVRDRCVSEADKTRLVGHQNGLGLQGVSSAVRGITDRDFDYLAHTPYDEAI